MADEKSDSQSDQANRPQRRPSSLADEVPPEFLCPLSTDLMADPDISSHDISCELMSDPVVIASGQTYERKSIRHWISTGHRTCPVTRLPLANNDLLPNYNLRHAIRTWASRRGVLLEEPEAAPARRPNDAACRSPEPAGAPAQPVLGLVLDKLLPRESAPGWPALQAVGQLYEGSSADKDAACFQLFIMASEGTERGRYHIVQAGAIPPLVVALADSSNFCKQHAARCFGLLCLSSDPVISQHCTAAIPHLVTLLEHGRKNAKESAARALFNLTAEHDINKFCVARAGAIPHLISLLSKPYPSEVTAMTHEHAASVLRNLAFNIHNRMEIATRGGIPILVQLVRRQLTLDATYFGIDALGSLTLLHENGREIVQAGALPLLVQALIDGNQWLKEAAARTLKNISFFQDLREACNAAGAVPALEATAEAGSARAVEFSRAAINNICAARRNRSPSPAAAPALAAAPDAAIDPALALNPPLSLSINGGGQQAEGSGVPWDGLRRMSLGGASPASLSAASRSNPRRRSSLVDEAPPEFLCPISCELMADPVVVASGQTYDRQAIQGWISTGHRTCPMTGVRLATLDLLPNHNLRHAIRTWALRRGMALLEPEGAPASGHNGSAREEWLPGWPALQAVGQLYAGSSVDKDKACFQLCSIAKEGMEQGKYNIVQAGAIPPLVVALSEGSNFCKNQAAWCFHLLCSSKNPVILQHCTSAISHLVTLLEHGSKETKESAVGALSNLTAEHDVNKFCVAKAGAIPRLISLLSKPYPSEVTAMTHEYAAFVLRDLASANHHNQKAIAREGGIPLLIQVVREQPTPDASYLGIVALGFFAWFSDNARAIVQAGALPVLVQALIDGNQRQKEAAARTLKNISDWADLREACFDAGAVPALQATAKTGSTTAALASTVAIKNICAPRLNRPRSPVAAPVLAAAPDAGRGAPLAPMSSNLLSTNGSCSNAAGQQAAAGGIPLDNMKPKNNSGPEPSPDARSPGLNSGGALAGGSEAAAGDQGCSRYFLRSRRSRPLSSEDPRPGSVPSSSAGPSNGPWSVPSSPRGPR